MNNGKKWAMLISFHYQFSLAFIKRKIRNNEKKDIAKTATV